MSKLKRNKSYQEITLTHYPTTVRSHHTHRSKESLLLKEINTLREDPHAYAARLQKTITEIQIDLGIDPTSQRERGTFNKST